MTSFADTITDPVELLRRGEWRYYFREWGRATAVGVALGVLEYATTAVVHRLVPGGGAGGRTVFAAVLSPWPWFLCVVSWRSVWREWETKRGRDLAGTPVESADLFQAKLIPLLGYMAWVTWWRFVALGGILLLVELAGPGPYHPVTLWLHGTWAEALGLVFREAFSSVALVLACWAVMVRTGGKAGGAALAAAAVAVGLLTIAREAGFRLAGPSPNTADAFLVLSSVVPAVVLALFVSCRFRELLVRE